MVVCGWGESQLQGFLPGSVLHHCLPERVCVGAVVRIVASPVPLQHGQMQNTIFQQPHTVFLLDRLKQLPAQNDAASQTYKQS